MIYSFFIIFELLKSFPKINCFIQVLFILKNLVLCLFAFSASARGVGIRQILLKNRVYCLLVFCGYCYFANQYFIRLRKFSRIIYWYLHCCFNIPEKECQNSKKTEGFRNKIILILPTMVVKSSSEIFPVINRRDMKFFQKNFPHIFCRSQTA